MQREPDYNEVAKWFVAGFQKSLPGNWIKGKLSRQELSLIETAQAFENFRDTVVSYKKIVYNSTLNFSL